MSMTQGGKIERSHNLKLKTGEKANQTDNLKEAIYTDTVKVAKRQKAQGTDNMKKKMRQKSENN